MYYFYYPLLQALIFKCLMVQDIRNPDRERLCDNLKVEKAKKLGTLL